jgi:hypothetical protein
MSDICKRVFRKAAGEKISRKGAKAQRGKEIVFAEAAESFWRRCNVAPLGLCEKKDLPVVILKSNRISTVQECDARMVKKEQRPGAKKV